MNCANHPDKAVAKYCRTCGKPLCNECVREVMGIAYCENCLAERVTGSAPSSPYSASAAPIAPSSGPNPGLAGILGAIPFGVGAVYNGQYAKGLAHLVIFILLVVGASHGHEPLDTICGLGIAAFVFYQIIDAVKTAKAINAGQAPPDPLGLGTMFSPGDRRDITRSSCRRGDSDLSRRLVSFAEHRGVVPERRCALADDFNGTRRVVIRQAQECGRTRRRSPQNPCGACGVGHPGCGFSPRQLA